MTDTGGETWREARRWVLGLIGLHVVALIALSLLSVALQWVPREEQPLLYLDVHLYRSVAVRLFDGAVPYRDLAIEYPPLALVPIVVPYLGELATGGGRNAYLLFFMLQTAALSALMAWTVARTAAHWVPARGVVASAGAYVLLAVAMAPLLAWRYDVFPACLSMLALLAVVNARPALAGTFLGLAIAAKLYPIVLVPVVVMLYLARRDHRSLRRVLTGAFGVTAALVLPTLVLADGGLPSYVSYHQARGLQVESAAAGVVALAGALGLPGELRIYDAYGAWNLDAPGVRFVLPWLSAALVCITAGMAWLSYVAFRGRAAASPATLVALCAAALFASMVASKVFSPQYLIWVVPFAALLPLGARLGTFAAVALTAALFNDGYADLLALELPSLLLLNARNALVAGLAVWIVIRIIRVARGSPAGRRFDRRPEPEVGAALGKL